MGTEPVVPSFRAVVAAALGADRDTGHRTRGYACRWLGMWPNGKQVVSPDNATEIQALETDRRDWTSATFAFVGRRHPTRVWMNRSSPWPRMYTKKTVASLPHSINAKARLSCPSNRS